MRSKAELMGLRTQHRGFILGAVIDSEDHGDKTKGLSGESGQQPGGSVFSLKLLWWLGPEVLN